MFLSPGTSEELAKFTQLLSSPSKLCHLKGRHSIANIQFQCNKAWVLSVGRPASLSVYYIISVCLFVCYICLYIIFTCLSVCLLVNLCLSVRSSVCLSICACLSVYYIILYLYGMVWYGMSVCYIISVCILNYICLSFYLYICPSVCYIILYLFV